VWLKGYVSKYGKDDKLRIFAVAIIEWIIVSPIGYFVGSCTEFNENFSYVISALLILLVFLK